MSDLKRTFRVFDTETTGLSHHYDQIIQFAGIAVDENLEYIPGDEILMDIRLRPDVVPSPIAFAIHGIDPKRLKRSPLNEFEAAELIQKWMMKTPSSVLTGFNSQSFDDEIVRNTFYRNMLDPYEHEWRNNNSRLDIYRLVLFVYALRPETIHWPVNEEGKVSLKLGEICKANGIELEHAHDARFDVIATIELMRIIKKNNPKIWDFFLKLSNKHEAKRQVEARKPLIMVERFLPRDHAHMTVTLPIIYDAKNEAKMLCFDLRHDPSEILTLSAEEIRRRCLTPVAELVEGEEIRAIRSITTNKQPMIAELNVLRGRDDVVQRAGLDIEKCLKHAELINEAGNDFRKRLQEAFKTEFPPCQDVYEGLYQLGFIDRDEHALRAKTRRRSEMEVSRGNKKVNALIPDIAKLKMVELSELKTRDRLRMFELGTRAKWANYSAIALKDPDIDPIELSAWIEHMDGSWNTLEYDEKDNRVNLSGFHQQMEEVRARFALDKDQESVLDELSKHVSQVAEHHKKLKAGYERLIGSRAKEMAADQPEPAKTDNKSVSRSVEAATDADKKPESAQGDMTKSSPRSEVDDFETLIGDIVKSKPRRKHDSSHDTPLTP